MIIQSQTLPSALPSASPEIARYSAPKPSHHASAETIDWPVVILGVAFDPVTMEQALDAIDQMIVSGQPHYVVTPNVDFVVQTRADDQLRRILLDAHLVLCDGMPLVWASRWLGQRIPERVAGSDLVPRMLERAGEQGNRIFLLGASEQANEEAVERIRADYPGVIVAGNYSPPFRPLEEMDTPEITRRVKAAQPDILLVSFGCPKQEKWMAANYRELGVPVCVGVGAVIDFLAGRVCRAPKWMGQMGLEWLHRMCHEPRRLVGRYANDFRYFAPAILRQYGQMRPRVGRVDSAGTVTVVHREPNAVYACVRGRLDRSSIQSDADLWRQIGTNGSDCILNLNQVEYIDSTGIALLLDRHQRLHQSGRNFVLEAPSSTVQNALAGMGLSDYFETTTAERADPICA